MTHVGGVRTRLAYAIDQWTYAYFIVRLKKKKKKKTGPDLSSKNRLRMYSLALERGLIIHMHILASIQ